MPITRDQELWGIALWVEKTYGDDGWLHIAHEQDRLLAVYDFEGARMWRAVGERFEKLTEGQHERPAS